MGTRLTLGVLICVTGASLFAEQQVERSASKADVVYRVTPRYPSRFQRAHIGGTGRFRMNIDFNTGKVRSVTVMKSTGSYGLDKEAVFALRQWRFKPGKRTTVDMPITFHTGGTLHLPRGARLVPNR
jgi:TonB family protein